MLFKLIKILNKREKKLNEIVDGVKNADFKFSLENYECLDALLENYFNYLRLSQDSRNRLKLRLANKTLICAIIYGMNVKLKFLNYDLFVQVLEVFLLSDVKKDI
jgi:hypothetical protein